MGLYNSAIIYNFQIFYDQGFCFLLIVPEEELEKRKEMRRSVVATRDLKAGDIISLADLDMKRPGTGISADKINTLVGRILKHDIKEDTLVLDDDLFLRRK